ncbi:MAG TPA: hypothetical protein PK586_03090 [Casimicrobium sp.]|nr:hypothetical protein [Casimicrobium sp.]
MQIPQIAALLFVAASCVVGVFQIALALGAPWGELTLGGRWRGSLPLAVRLIPLLSVALLALFLRRSVSSRGLGAAEVPVAIADSRVVRRGLLRTWQHRQRGNSEQARTKPLAARGAIYAGVQFGRGGD